MISGDIAQPRYAITHLFLRRVRYGLMGRAAAIELHFIGCPDITSDSIYIARFQIEKFHLRHAPNFKMLRSRTIVMRR